MNPLDNLISAVETQIEKEGENTTITLGGLLRILRSLK